MNINPDKLADDPEDDKRLPSPKKIALSKIKIIKAAKARKFQEGSHGTQFPEQFAIRPVQPLGFSNCLFRGLRQSQPYDKCFSCQQRGHWADTPACPNYAF